MDKNIDDELNPTENLSDLNNNINSTHNDTPTFTGELDDLLSEFNSIHDNSFHNTNYENNDSINNTDDIKSFLDNSIDNVESKSSNKKPRFVVHNSDDEENKLTTDNEKKKHDNIDTSDLENMSKDDLFDLILNEDDDEDEDDFLNSLKSIDIENTHTTKDAIGEEIDDDDESLANALDDYNFFNELNELDELDESLTSSVIEENDDFDNLEENLNDELQLNKQMETEVANKNPEHFNVNEIIKDTNLNEEVETDSDDLMSLLGINNLDELSDNIGTLSEDELDDTLAKLRKQNEKSAKLAEVNRRASLKNLLKFSSIIYSIIIIALIFTIIFNLNKISQFENILNFNISNNKDEMLELDRIIWDYFNSSEQNHHATNEAFYKYLDGNYSENDLITLINKNIDIQTEMSNIARSVYYDSTSEYIFSVTNFAYNSSLESEYILNFIETKDVKYLSDIKRVSATMTKSKNTVLIKRNDFMQKIEQLK